MRRLGNPRLHFVLLGLLAFALDARFGGDTTPLLSISPEGLEIIRVPPPDALDGALTPEDWVEQEMLYREARRLGLDRGDSIVRRRLVQKMDHMLQMIAGSDSYERSDVAAYYAARREAYRRPATYSFGQVYLDPRQRGDELEAQARTLREILNQRDVPAAEAGAHGDAYTGRSRWMTATPTQIREGFGAEFLAALEAAEPGRWIGPLRSKLGWHLLRVERVTPPHTPPLDAVWNRVVSDFDRARRAEAREAALEKIRQRYAVRGLEVP